MIDLTPIMNEATDEAFADFIEYGRIRRIVKSVDPYACVYARDDKMYAAFSTGQTIACNKFRGIKSEAVRGWLLALYLIRRGGL